MCIISTRNLKSVKNSDLKRYIKTAINLNKFQGGVETFPPVGTRILKKQVCNTSYYFLHFEARILKGISVLSKILYVFIILSSLKNGISACLIFILNCVYSKSYSQEKEVAWATPNSMNKLYPMYGTMHHQSNTTAVVFM